MDRNKGLPGHFRGPFSEPSNKLQNVDIIPSQGGGKDFVVLHRQEQGLPCKKKQEEEACRSLLLYARPIFQLPPLTLLLRLRGRSPCKRN